MPQNYQTKVLIIGAGPAGYTAGIYAARANLQPIIVQGMQPGGQLTITTEVENFPGFAKAVQGPWLMEQMQEQARHVGCNLIGDVIVDVDFTKRPFVCTAESGAVFTADSVIIATGAQARWLGLESEMAFQGYGVSGCATCDGFFFRGKQVAVVGGGNTAMEEALYLTNHATKVSLIHRRDSFRGEKVMQERVKNHPKIEILWNTVVEAVEGVREPVPGVTGLQIKNIKTNEARTLKLDGVFIAIGHDPATKIFKGKIDMDDEGYIITRPNLMETSVTGVFAAGDVRDKIFRQAVMSAGMGCQAALEAEKFLSHK